MSIDAESLRLVASARDGDRGAADALVRAHEPWLRSVVYAVTGRPELVDDVIQQVWERAWQQLGTLADPSRLRPWLYSIARHTAIDAGTAAKRERTVQRPLSGEEHHPDRRQAEPARAVVGKETQVELVRAVQALPALYREPFVLRHLEDWSYAEIGEVLGLPATSVETRLVRARRMLREMLEGRIVS